MGGQRQFLLKLICYFLYASTLMDALKETCPIKTNLLVAWQSAAETYSKAVAEFTRHIGVLPKAEYDKLAHATEETHKNAVGAQADLEAHIADHGCGEVAA
jgi:hypothetical protein